MSEITAGAMVQLLPGREEVYPRALAGSQGSVFAVKEDEYGFHQVYVHWDKNHWRYNGEEDCWTFADHFEVIGDAPTNELEVEPFEIPVVPEEFDSDQRMQEYLEMLMVAFEKASESHGFYLITMKRDMDPEIGEMFVVDVLQGTSDPALKDIPASELFHFVEQEMRKRFND